MWNNKYMRFKFNLWLSSIYGIGLLKNKKVHNTSNNKIAIQHISVTITFFY